MVDVHLTTTPERAVYALKNVGPYGTIGDAFQRVLDHVRTRRETVRDVFGVFCDDPAQVPEAERTSYACVEVEGTPTPAGDIEVRRISAGPIATATAQGPYGGSEVHEAYRTRYRWIATGGAYEALDRAARSPFERACREAYPNDPAHTKAEDLLTVIQVPVRATKA